jgi:hypothetical protein
VIRFAIALVAALACPALAATPEQEAALREIERFTAQQERSDPHYRTVEDEMLKGVDAMVKSTPPREWLPTIRRTYFALSERAHIEERARIRADEVAATGGVIAPAPGAIDAYVNRLNALEQQLAGGKLGPREHALHALEAARAVYPQDAHLIALREAKVSLATEYELGNITRPQYDERWARARSVWQQQADAREQTMARQFAIEPAAVRPDTTVGDRVRAQRGMTCRPNGLGAVICR